MKSFIPYFQEKLTKLIFFFKNIIRDDLAKDAFVVFLGTSFTNLLNLLYSIFLLRNLTPVDFGLFNSLLAILVLFSQFPATVTSVLTRFISRYHAHGKFAEIKGIILSLGTKVAGAGVLIFFGIVAIHHPLSRFLNVPDNKIFLLLSLTILSAYLGTVPGGALQGLQKFSHISFTSFIGGVIKLILVILLVKFGFGVSGALSAFLFSNIFSILLYMYFLKITLDKEHHLYSANKKMDFKEVYSYFWPVFIFSLINVSLSNVDIVMVKHLFSPLEAGFYSIAQVAGKIVLFFPGAIFIVMFPKVAKLQAKGEDTVGILKRSLGYIFMLSGGMAFISIIFPKFVLKVLARQVYPECIPLVRLFCVDMVILSMVFVFLNYYLSLNVRKYLYYFLAAVALEIILIGIFHQTLIQVLLAIFVSLFSLLIFNFIVAFKKHP